MTETGAQLFARLEGRRALKDIEPRLFPEDGGPNHGEVVELHGKEGAGKTELLYHLVCRCVLPLEAGGLGVEVMFVDTDYNFDMLRLVTILENRLATAPNTATAEGPSSSSSSVGGDSEEALLRSCLSRLLVVHCSSSSQLLLTLHYLETSFCSRPSLSLLLIDSISAFYWMDRCGGGESVAKQEEKLRKCSELLARLLRDYRITVFATTHAIMKNYGSSASDAYTSSSSSSEYDRPYLCRSWQRLVTHRLVCSKGREAGSNMATPTGAKMATTTSIKDQRRRQVFNAHCTSSSSSSSSSSMTKTKAYRSCSLNVTDGGVVFI